MKITVIGAGNMGGALIKGLAKKAIHQLIVTARTEATLSRITAEYPEVQTSLNNVEAVKGADIVVLAVKPWLVRSVIEEIKDSLDFDRQVILSVAANVFTETLREYLGCPTANVFYVMPNIAAEYNESMTFWLPPTVFHPN